MCTRGWEQEGGTVVKSSQSEPLSLVSLVPYPDPPVPAQSAVPVDTLAHAPEQNQVEPAQNQPQQPPQPEVQMQ